MLPQERICHEESGADFFFFGDSLRLMRGRIWLMAAAAACATIVIVSQMDFGAVELLDRHSGIKALTTSANADQSRGGEFAKVDDRDFVLLTPSPADLP
jgi:hypothetical protein